MGCGDVLDWVNPLGKGGEFLVDPLGSSLGIKGPGTIATHPWDAGSAIKSDWSMLKHLLVPDMRQDREIQVQSATNARTIVYGRTRVGNQFAYAETTGTNSEIFHILCIHAGHEIDGFEEIYFDDHLVATAAGGWVVQAPYTGKATIEFFDGSQTAAAASLIAASAGGWTSAHKLLGVAYTHVTLTYDDKTYPAGMPIVKAVIRGKKVLDPRTGVIAWSDNPALCIRDYMLTPVRFGGMGCDADEINEASFTAAANVCDQTVYSYIPPDQAPGVKTLHKPVPGVDPTYPEKRYTLNGEIKLDGAPTQFVRDMLTSCAGEAVYSGGEWKLYAGGPASSVATIDESWLNGGVSFQTGANKNGKINFAKGTFTNSNDYWVDTEFPPVPVGVSTPPNASYWNVLATPSRYDETLTYAIGQYVTWASKVYLAYNNVPLDQAPPAASYWVLVEEYDAGSTYPISHTIQRAGVVYQSNASVPASNTYLAEDSGELLTGNLALPFTIHSSLAQRLAKITLEKSRRGLTVNYPCNHRAFAIDVMDVVAVNNTRLGWSGKLFRVVGWSFSLMGGVLLSLAEYDGAIYDWVAGDSTPLVPPVMTNLPDPRLVYPPSNIVLTPRKYETNAGMTARVDLDITWDAAGPGTPTYQLQYKLTADSTWSAIIAVSDTAYVLTALAAGDYDVRIRAINSIGATSDWVTQSGYVPNTTDTVPNVTGLMLDGDPLATEFTGRDVKVVWNYVAPPGSPVGGLVGRANSWFRYYVVRIYNGADVLRRTEYTMNENYTYTYDLNRQDGAGTATRTVKFSVTVMAAWGDESPVPASLTLTNPPPAALSTLALTGAVNLLSVGLPGVSDPDFAGYMVHASQTPAFTPDASNQINSGGPGTVVTKIDMAAGIWYVKAAAYDSFGTDSLNYSAQYQVVVDSLTIVPELLDSVQRVDFMVRDTIFYFAGDVLNWDDGAIDRGDASYALDSSTLSAAQSSYIIATLNDSTFMATLSKVAVGAGIPTLTDSQVIIALTSEYTTPQGNYICFVRQANSMSIEGALIRSATITDAHITGTLSANKITSLNGATTISGAGIVLSDYGTTATWAGVSGAGKPADNATVGATWGSNLSGRPTNLASLTGAEDIENALLDPAIADAATRAAWGNITSIPARFGNAPAGAGLCITSSYMGYYNGSAWKTYTDSSGNFYLSGSGSHSLSWNGSTLTIRGSLTADDIQSGGTITGSTLQTATSGERFVVNASSKAAHFYDSAGVEKIWIGTAYDGYGYTYGTFGSLLSGETKTGLSGLSYGGTGLHGRSVTGIAVLGLSDVIGGRFAGGSYDVHASGSGIVYLNPITSWPSSPSAGMVVYNNIAGNGGQGWLCYYSGITNKWHATNGVQVS